MYGRGRRHNPIITTDREIKPPSPATLLKAAQNCLAKFERDYRINPSESNRQGVERARRWLREAEAMQ